MISSTVIGFVLRNQRLNESSDVSCLVDTLIFMVNIGQPI